MTTPQIHRIADRPAIYLSLKPCGDCWLHINAPSGKKASINLGQRGSLADQTIVGQAIREIAEQNPDHPHAPAVVPEARPPAPAQGETPRTPPDWAQTPEREVQYWRTLAVDQSRILNRCMEAAGMPGDACGYALWDKITHFQRTISELWKWSENQKSVHERELNAAKADVLRGIQRDAARLVEDTARPVAPAQGEKLWQDIPGHLVSQAYEIDSWMQQNGHKHYELGPIASRELVATLRQSVARLTQERDVAREQARASESALTAVAWPLVQWDKSGDSPDAIAERLVAKLIAAESELGQITTELEKTQYDLRVEQDECRKFQAELVELRKDRERLDWLEGSKQDMLFNPNVPQWVMGNSYTRIGMGTDNLRSALDAARQQREGA